VLVVLVTTKSFIGKEDYWRQLVAVYKLDLQLSNFHHHPINFFLALHSLLVGLVAV